MTSLLLAGCNSGGGGNQGFSASDTSVQSTSSTTGGGNTPAQTATITINQTLAKAVPANVVNERFTGFNAANAVVFGPSVQAKAAQIVLTVPVTMTQLRIDYLDANGNVLFVYTQAVSLTVGGNLVITDPSFTAPGTSSLKFTVQPSNVLTGSAISPAVQVSVVDSNNNVVTTATDSITVAIGTNPGGATLGGTKTVAAVNGVATFSDLTLDKAANGYTLTASASGLTGATSSTFNDVRVLSFAAPFSLASATGAQPQNIGAGDFNNDGKDDLVTLDNNQVLVFVNKGDGTFNNGVGYATGASPNALIVIDVNNDGLNDVVVACQTEVDFLTSKGDGTLNAAVAVTTGNNNSNLRGICGGRFLKTQLNDIAVIDGADNSVYLYGNNGNLNFTVQNVPTNDNNLNAHAMSTGDFNGDGVPDFCIASFNTKQAYWLNSGTGNIATAFQAGGYHNLTLNSPNGFCQSIVAGDLNADGFADIVSPDDFPTNPNNEANVFLSQGAGGTFASPVVYGIGRDPFGVAVADFNLDGKQDLGLSCFVGLNNNADLEILLGNGDGTFQTVQEFNAGDGDVRSIAVGDFNGDGLPDAAVSGGKTWVFLNTSK